MMLQVEILQVFFIINNELEKGIKKKKKKLVTDLAASAFHLVISSETDKMIHLTFLRSFM